MAFNEFGELLANLHVREGASASDGALGTAVDGLNLENQQTVSGVGEY